MMKRFLLLLVLCAPLAIAAQGFLNQERLYDKELVYFEKGEFERVIGSLSKIDVKETYLDVNDITNIYRLLTLSHYELGNIEESYDAYQQLLEFAPWYRLSNDPELSVFADNFEAYKGFFLQVDILSYGAVVNTTIDESYALAGTVKESEEYRSGSEWGLGANIGSYFGKNRFAASIGGYFQTTTYTYTGIYDEIFNNDSEVARGVSSLKEGSI
jgi:tetratricopeptide (TPR) repeat protein